MIEVQICEGRTCSERFSSYMKTRIENDIDFHELKDVSCWNCMCLWACQEWPNVVINGEIHKKMNGAKLSELIVKLHDKS